MGSESGVRNILQDADREAHEQRTPFFTCRSCQHAGICPIPSRSSESMFVPDPGKCWLEQLARDPANGKSLITKLLLITANRIGLLEMELGNLNRTMELLSNALQNSGDIKVVGPGALVNLGNRLGHK